MTQAALETLKASRSTSVLQPQLAFANVGSHRLDQQVGGSARTSAIRRAEPKQVYVYPHYVVSQLRIDEL